MNYYVVIAKFPWKSSGVIYSGSDEKESSYWCFFLVKWIVIH